MRQSIGRAEMFGIAICIFAFAMTVVSSAREPPRRILIINENDPTQPAVIDVSRGLHRGLDDREPTRFEMYSEYLDASRFPGPENLERVAAQLASKYHGVRLDAVVVIGPRALDFMLTKRESIAPGIPLFFGAISDDSLAARNLPPNVRGVASSYDLRRTLGLARALQPASRKAVIVYGSGEFDSRWGKSAKAELGSRYLDFDIDYLTNLGLDEFGEALAKLSKDTVVLLLTIFEDADGHNFLPRNAAAKIAPLSGAPVYVVYDTFLGNGPVGGYMGTFQDVGEQLAGVISRVLAGESSAPQVTLSVARPIVDWRQLMRFGLDPAKLPEDTEIRFREPSVWNDYKAEILGAVGLIALQSGLIAALFFQARRRKKAEEEVAESRRELTHLSRASLLGGLSGAFAHELNQPLTAILANAEAGRRLLEKREPDLEEVKQILGEIVFDDKRAAEVIAQLRKLLVKGETVLEPVDLIQVVASTLNLAKSEFLVRQTKIDFTHGTVPATVLGNFAQLQQIVLNLIVNAAEATSDQPPGSRLIKISVGMKDARTYELAVYDNGPGLTPEMKTEVFKPFFSTKSNGLGLGLAICRSIALAHGGNLQFDTVRSSGASIALTLPAGAVGA